MPPKKERITAGELIARLEKDPEYQAKQAAWELEAAVRLEQDRKEQAELVDDLKAVGIDVTSIRDLVHRYKSYPAAIPVLLRHLKRPYSERTREAIARSLTVPDAAYAWDELLKLFLEDSETKTNGVKWAIGCVLSDIAKKTKRYDEVLTILRDRTHGANRLALIDVLAESRKPDIRAHVEDFADDPDLKIQVGDYLKKWERARKRKEK